MAYRIAYMRTSTDQQETAIQRADIEKHGFDRIFTDEGISGKVRDRPELMKALDALQPGNEFIVWKLDRLGRSAVHLMQIIEGLSEKGINFVSLREGFDLSTPIGRAMFKLAAVFAEMERETIEERRNAGLKLAREKGVKFGRKTAADPSAKTDKSGRLAKAMLAVAGGQSIRSAAKEHRIGEATIHRHIAANSEGRNDRRKTECVTEGKPRKNGHLNGHATSLSASR